MATLYRNYGLYGGNTGGTGETVISKSNSGIFLAIQWLRHRLPVQGGVGSIPRWGPKIPHAWWPKKSKHRTEAIL